MRSFDEKLEFLMLAANPLFWMLVIAVGIKKTIVILWKYTGIAEWYFIYFKMHKLGDKEKLGEISRICRLRADKSKTLYTKWRYTKGALKADSLL